MSLRKIGMLAMSLGLICGLHEVAPAQESSSCSTTLNLFFPDPPPPGGYGCLDGYPGTYQYTCLVRTNQCMPPPCPTCGVTAGSPVNLATGDTAIEDTDISIPGLGGGLLLKRTWNSKWPSLLSSPQGMFGANWRTNFEESVFVGSDHYIRYTFVNGGGAGAWSFGYTSGTSLGIAIPKNMTAGLTWSSSTWTLQFHDGTTKVFNSNTGLLTSIVDRNGNSTQLSYDGSNRLTTVTDAAGRHVYFVYTGSVVAQVNTDFGISLSYTYDSQGRLSQVTKPDQSTIHYTYDQNSMITSVADAQGKVIESHTYDGMQRGLTSSRANGVEAVTISY